MIEIAEIFRVHGPAYREKFGPRMPRCHLRAMQAIEGCRTSALGGEVYFCKTCAELRYSYHSCKNRHCPKCQSDQASEWLQSQAALLLPARSFLVTFTVPEQLRALVRSHQRTLLNILFRTSAEALQQLARDPRFLGGQIGMLGVLHTWTRADLYHPHIHYIVPAGALSGERWIASRSSDFLVPVKALSTIFRAKFRDAVKKMDRADRTQFFASVPSETWKKPWVVHCKGVGNGEHALKYLARYVFRVAITNSRIRSFENGRVTFDYKDAELRKRQICTLSAEEFIRRFLQHVLPPGFIKVRYYGLFAPSNRGQLQKARELVEAQQNRPLTLTLTMAHEETKRSPDICPKCGTRMSLLGPVTPRAP